MTIVYGLIFATLDLWAFFAFTMWVARGKRDIDELNIFQKIIVVIFAYKDVVYNYTWGALLFWEFASNDRKLLTARLKHILFSGHYSVDSWRWKRAHFMCKYMIEPLDFGHCNLAELDAV